VVPTVMFLVVLLLATRQLGVTLLQRFQLMQHLVAVERPDVARLNGREATHRPTEMDEVRLDRVRERVHPDLLRQPVALTRIARAARGDHVGPVIRATPRNRNEVIACERFARLELGHVTAAVLTAIRVAREQERVGDVASKTTRHVHEPRQANDSRARNRQPFGSHDPIVVGLDDFRLTVDHQPQRALHRNHRQWFERRI